jgi:hypothetical protein
MSVDDLFENCVISPLGDRGHYLLADKYMRPLNLTRMKLEIYVELRARFALAVDIKVGIQQYGPKEGATFALLVVSRN